MTPTIYYCYDAYCGWCYGFSLVIQKIAAEYKDQIFFETLSGGMIPKESSQHIGKMASYIKGAYKNVEDMTGIKYVYPHLGIRTNHYKLVYFYTINEWELYDLKKDPAEKNNIYSDPANKTLVSQLKKQLIELRSFYQDTDPAGELN